MPVQFSNDALESNLEASVWSYACITGNSEAVASLPGIVQKPGGENADKWIEDQRKGPLHHFLEEPLGNRYSDAPRWNWQQLIETICQQLYLSGNSYLLPLDLDKGHRLSVRLILDPDAVDVTADPNGFPILYSYKGNHYTPDQICNIQNAHPGSYHKGHAPLSAAWRDIQIDGTAHKRQMYNLQNRLGAGLVIKSDSYFGGPDDEQIGRMKAQLAADYQASTSDGTPMVFGANTSIEKLPQQGHGKDLVDVRSFARAGNLAVLRTPPPIIGEFESATLQNFDRAVKIWWQNALFPMAGTIYNAINAQIVRPRFPKIRLWYDITASDIGLLVLRDRIAAAKELTDLGYPTNLAAARVGLNMEFVPELDQVNRDVAKAGRDPEVQPEPKTEPDQPEPAADPAPAATVDA